MTPSVVVNMRLQSAAHKHCAKTMQDCNAQLTTWLTAMILMQQVSPVLRFVALLTCPKAPLPIMYPRT